MAIKWSDIAYHTAPAVAVSLAMGFGSATALSSVSMPFAAVLMAAFTVAAMSFAYIWTPREQKQHGGHLGGTQSRLEAFIPLVCGVLAYPLAFLAFWKLGL
jgi:multisubunit Na+/H+ antiporter MnhB subunit